MLSVDWLEYSTGALLSRGLLQLRSWHYVNDGTDCRADAGRSTRYVYTGTVASGAAHTLCVGRATVDRRQH